MANGVNGGGRDGALWRQGRDSWAEAAAPREAPDAAALAAYLDGTLDEAARDRVEAWMAASQDGLDLVLAAREALAGPAGEAPAAWVRRAQGIVRDPAPAARGRGAWLGRLGAGLAGLWQPTAWAGVAVAVLLASASGFEMGRIGVTELSALNGIVAQDLDFGLDPGAGELL